MRHGFSEKHLVRSLSDSHLFCNKSPKSHAKSRIIIVVEMLSLLTFHFSEGQSRLIFVWNEQLLSFLNRLSDTFPEAEIQTVVVAHDRDCDGEKFVKALDEKYYRISKSQVLQDKLFRDSIYLEYSGVYSASSLLEAVTSKLVCHAKEIFYIGANGVLTKEIAPLVQATLPLREAGELVLEDEEACMQSLSNPLFCSGKRVLLCLDIDETTLDNLRSHQQRATVLNPEVIRFVQSVQAKYPDTEICLVTARHDPQLHMKSLEPFITLFDDWCSASVSVNKQQEELQAAYAHSKALSSSFISVPAVVKALKAALDYEKDIPVTFTSLLLPGSAEPAIRHKYEILVKYAKQGYLPVLLDDSNEYYVLKNHMRRCSAAILPPIKCCLEGEPLEADTQALGEKIRAYIQAQKKGQLVPSYSHGGGT